MGTSTPASSCGWERSDEIGALAASAIRDDNHEVRQCALDALIKTTNAALVSSTLLAATFDEEESIREAALFALNQRLPELAKSIAPRLAMLDDDMSGDLAREILE